MRTASCTWQQGLACFSARRQKNLAGAPGSRLIPALDIARPELFTGLAGQRPAVPCEAINVTPGGIVIALFCLCGDWFDSVFKRGHCTYKHLLSLTHRLGCLRRFFDVIRRRFIFLFIMVTCY